MHDDPLSSNNNNNMDIITSTRQQCHTTRTFINPSDTNTNTNSNNTNMNMNMSSIVGERVSQTLLLSLLKHLSVLYLIMSALSIPVWVFSTIQFTQYTHTMHQANQQITPTQITLIATSAYVGYRQQCLHENKYITIDNASINNTNNNNTPIDNNNNNSNSSSNTAHIQQCSPYLIVCLYYTLFLQLFLLAGLCWLQYSSFKSKQCYKGTCIQDYSLAISNAPVMQPYIMIPKLEAYLKQHLHNKMQIIQGTVQIFDMVSLCAQQKYMQYKLQQQRDRRASLNLAYQNMQHRSATQQHNSLIQIQYMLHRVSTSNVKSDTIFITFQTRQARYRALRFLQSSACNFMSCSLKVSKAPHPLQLLSENFHRPLWSRIVSQLLILTVCMMLLFGFDLLILLIHKSQYPLLASMVILLLQILLKSIIIWLSHYQVHLYKSQLHLSIFSKLTKYLYINTALIIFISSFDFGDVAIVNTFSTRSHKYIIGNQAQWFKTVGLSILIGFVIQIIYVNVRPVIQISKAWLIGNIKHTILNIYYHKYRQSTQQQQQHKKQQQQQQQQKQKKQQKKQSPRIQLLKSQLYICYAHLTSLLMFSSTYSFTHPVLYPLTSLLCLLAYYTHRKYIAEYTQPAPHNNDYLNQACIQYLYMGIVMHCIIVYIGYRFVPALVMGIIIAAIVLATMRCIRRKIGPFCFSKFQQVYGSTIRLSSLLNQQQINKHIHNMNNRITMYTYLYNNTHEQQNFITKGCLQRCIKQMETQIDQLQQNKQNRVNQHIQIQDQNKQSQSRENNHQQNNNKQIGSSKIQSTNINSKSSKSSVRGVISYCFTEQILRN